MNQAIANNHVIVLFTDFGLEGPYVGQIKSVLAQTCPQARILDLMHDAPRYDPVSSAYLLAALVSEFPIDSIFLCVVDPGVGGERDPVAVNIGNHWFVGPDNGLFEVVAAQAGEQRAVTWWKITYQPKRLSASFHGRDIFAPVAAMLANGNTDALSPLHNKQCDTIRFPHDLYRVIYIDHFGNAITGLRSQSITKLQSLELNGFTIPWAKTFSEVRLGEGFWFNNSNGLVEIAVNQGRADQSCQIKVGNEFQVTAN